MRLSFKERRRRLASGRVPKANRRSHSVMVWVRPKLREQLEEWAGWEGKSVSGFCRMVLEQYVKERP